MNKTFVRTALAAILFSTAIAGHAAERLRITLVTHSASTNAFWQSVKRGMDDACKLYDVQCQLLFAQKEGDLANALRNFQTAVAQKVDGVAVAIIDDKAFDQPVAEAIAKGVTVLGVNVDDSEGAAGNAREAFIGQSFDAAGVALVRTLEAAFPKQGPLNVLVGVSAPGQNWAETRAKGMLKALADFKGKHPERQINVERIDSGTDLAITTQRVTAYLDRNPQTNVYLDCGYWVAGVAQALKTKGVPPGKVVLGGFDLVPVVLDRMEEGYIQGAVDQQPYLQGYLPIVQIVLMKRYKLSAWDVNTGSKVIRPQDVPEVRELAKQGIR